jgi:hypothetical protein
MENAPYDVDQFPEVAAILRTGNRAKYRLSEHFCECKKGKRQRFAEVFETPAGPILLGFGLLPTGDVTDSAAARLCATWPANRTPKQPFRCNAVTTIGT